MERRAIGSMKALVRENDRGSRQPGALRSVGDRISDLGLTDRGRVRWLKQDIDQEANARVRRVQPRIQNPELRTVALQTSEPVMSGSAGTY